MPARPPAAPFRTFPIRVLSWTALMAFALPALFLAACDPSATGSPAVPASLASPLYECKGTPGYAGTWEDILRGLRNAGDLDSLDRTPCPKTSGTLPGVSLMVLGDTAASVEPESTRVRIVVLDAQCRVKREYADTAVFPPGRGSTLGYIRWDGRFADGSKAPTGEYYINTVFEWKTGEPDTAWSKVGMLQFDCAD
jgi:hypothetical protein